jgi:Tfp pilus assembly protein PilF
MNRAKELGDKLIKKEPDNANYLDTYGWILFRMRNYDSAKQYLEKAVEKGNSGVVIEHLGDVLYKLGEKDKAVEKWKKAKEVGGDVSPKLEQKIATKTLVNE